MTERSVIVNADDFGLSERTNAGVIQAHEKGIVTSASLMVRGPAAAHAAEYAREHRELGVGLHVDLGEWRHEGGEWIRTYECGPPEEELPRQLERFRTLLGRDPTHLDSHQHVHREEPVASLVSNLGRELGVPVRNGGSINYCGAFYGQTGTGESLPDAITPGALIRLIEGLPPGVTELACHPGLDAELGSPYRLERLREVEALCDPDVRAALERAGATLRSFAELS